MKSLVLNNNLDAGFFFLCHGKGLNINYVLKFTIKVTIFITYEVHIFKKLFLQISEPCMPLEDIF